MRIILFQLIWLLLLSSTLFAQETMGEKIYREGMFAYPNGKMKALILSYDDGLQQDSILVAMLNQYGLKGTFNLNSAYFGKNVNWLKNLIGKSGRYLNEEQISRIYQGHEISAHTHTHPHLPELTKDEIDLEIRTNIEALSNISKKKIVSFAYPFGEYKQEARELLKRRGISNARTINDTETFELSNNFLLWNPTCHHSQANEFLPDFTSKSAQKPILFHIWGHSWEFDGNQENNNWEYFENICLELKNTNELWSATAGEFVEYIKAIRSISGKNELLNNSSLVLWLRINGKMIEIQPQEKIRID
ncbi:polysaccharide deacetylase family protein [Marinifilum caeruleilacunae]|uniref:NodB homology domain-containing protein n=1 Tax=Marinifilum caeruleilacunae TaxID=2499076 RepID=A0ABX1WW98_9BACT|nr:polysaccharide deacetylase family protein [Marinifilum caeruleilacunae]NOU60403.1 hypothetical protein [Marinifilum caeruleilacunae]